MLRTRVSESKVKALVARTARLAALVEHATQRSRQRDVREGGAQLIDLLNERIEEIRELQADEDEELMEKFRSFELRVALAEAKVRGWPQTPAPGLRSKASARHRPPSRRAGGEKRREKTAA